MSDANREQMQELVNQMWAVVVDGVSASRGIASEELNRLADELAVTLPQQALEHKFIDGVKYADQMEELFEQEYDIEDPEFVSLGDYASSLVADPKRASAPKVAIVYANGQVMDGRGSDDNIYGYTLSETIREVAEDDDIKSVVLRVNSPGGSALASDIIWREVENLKAKKPVIVSMGEYAASGDTISRLLPTLSLPTARRSPARLACSVCCQALARLWRTSWALRSMVLRPTLTLAWAQASRLSPLRSIVL